MGTNIFFLACLAGTCYGHREQRTGEALRGPNPRRGLAMLLLASHPIAGWQVPGARQGVGLPRTVAIGRRAGAHRSVSHGRTGKLSLADKGDTQTLEDTDDPFILLSREFRAAFGDGVNTFGPGVPKPGEQKFESIPSIRAAILCAKEGWTYLDVRNPDELNQVGRPDVPKYFNIPSHYLTGFEADKWLKEVEAVIPDKKSGIVVGGAVSVSTRSKAASQALVNAGYERVKEVEDGYFGWLQRGSDMTLYETFSDVGRGDEDASEMKPAPVSRPAPVAQVEDLTKLRVPQLKAKLRGLGLKVSGTKAELIARLEDHTAQQQVEAPPEVAPAQPPDKTPAPAPMKFTEGKMVGTVRSFDTNKGFGFIAPRDGSPDVFVHQTAVYARGFRSLAEGEVVEFNVEEQKNGKLKATDVTGPSGGYVQGAPREGFREMVAKA